MSFSWPAKLNFSQAKGHVQISFFPRQSHSRSLLRRRLVVIEFKSTASVKGANRGAAAPTYKFIEVPGRGKR
jgi:hypothetical protein